MPDPDFSVSDVKLFVGRCPLCVLHDHEYLFAFYFLLSNFVFYFFVNSVI